jgi:PAS domain S-box-containing protein
VNLLKMAEGVSGMGHWRLDLRSKRVVWSKEVYAIHGLSPDSFDPNLDRAVDFYHPDDQPKFHAALDEAISSAGPVGFQLRLRCADGDVRDVVGRSLCERDRSDTPVAVFGVFQDITEHTRALAAARRNEERYRLLAENMADVVTRIRPDGSSNYISPAIQQLLGYRPEEMAGRSAQDFVHPEDQAAVVSVFATLCRSEAQRTIEVRAVRKDGALRWVEVSFRSMPMEKGGFEIVAVIRDITARRELESAAAERERLYRLLADNSIDLINRSSLDSEILYVSPSARELTGYEPDELIGRKTTDLIHPEDWPYVRRAYTKLVHFGHAARVEPITYRMVRKDGAHVWVEVAPRAGLGRRQADRVCRCRPQHLRAQGRRGGACRGAHGRGGGCRGQGAVPRHHEPRATHTAHEHSRLHQTPCRTAEPFRALGPGASSISMWPAARS